MTYTISDGVGNNTNDAGLEPATGTPKHKWSKPAFEIISGKSLIQSGAAIGTETSPVSTTFTS